MYELSQCQRFFILILKERFDDEKSENQKSIREIKNRNLPKYQFRNLIQFSYQRIKQLKIVIHDQRDSLFVQQIKEDDRNENKNEEDLIRSKFNELNSFCFLFQKF
ncbi:unnamed protein product [Paramecium sonneborni]|uniref:Uncharacterized protein n=1 Tax=Paramecium sonneborni TaxID=65129 RepID=A0A8S1Q699_9CILI|nr:unnamed protein product [Paramecium sonneborni]